MFGMSKNQKPKAKTGGMIFTSIEDDHLPMEFDRYLLAK